MTVVGPRKAKPGGYLFAPPAPAAAGLPVPSGQVCSGDRPHARGAPLLRRAGRDRRLGSAGTGHQLPAPTPRPDAARVPGSATGPC